MVVTVNMSVAIQVNMKGNPLKIDQQNLKVPKKVI